MRGFIMAVGGLIFAAGLFGFFVIAFSYTEIDKFPFWLTFGAGVLSPLALGAITIAVGAQLPSTAKPTTVKG